MKKPLLLAIALAASATPLHAQGGEGAAAPAAPAQIDPERAANIQRAALVLRVFNIAFESQNVSQPVKGQLLSCLYNNKLTDIAAATGRVFDNNPNLKRDDAGVVYRVAAGVCGITFRRTDGADEPVQGGAAPAPARTPAPRTPAPAAGNGEGR